jgi:hypothetical protein
VENLQSYIATARARYGATLTADQCVELLNTALWHAGNADFGLARKPSGNHGTRYDGVPCSVDGVVHRPSNTFIDALVKAADGPKNLPGVATPAWQVGAAGANSREFVPAIAPQVDEPPVEEPPVVEQPPVPTCDCSAKLAELEARLGVVERRPEVPASVLVRLNALEGAKYRVEAKTTTSAWHAHDLRADVVRVR